MNKMQSPQRTFLALGLALLLLLSACRGQSATEPTIHNVTLSPPIPLAGQPVTITWDVTGANMVDLLPVVNSLPVEQKAYTFQDGFQQATTILFIARSAEASAQREMIIPILPTATVPATPLPTASATLPGTATASATPTLVPSLTPSWTPLPVDPIIQVWSATPLQVIAGETVTLRWKVAQATSVIIEPFGSQPLEGQLFDQPGTNRVYNLIASNGNRSVTQSIVVMVATPRPPQPTIRQFSASPSTAIRGYTSSVRLSWDTANADNVWIDPGIGQVNLSGQRNIAVPSADTLFTLTARNASGEARSQIWVRVVDPSCTTLTPWSDLFPGPGTAYGPALQDLPQGAVLIPHNYNDMGSGGDWVYVTYTKTGAKGWSQDKPGYLSCNIDITDLPSAPVPFSISSVSVTPSPANYSGPCPVTIRTTARITVTGAGQATYRWVRSDGVGQPQQTISFSGSGYKDVTYDWEINNIIGSYWIAMSFTSPSSFTTNQAPFSVTCMAPTLPPYP